MATRLNRRQLAGRRHAGRVAQRHSRVVPIGADVALATEADGLVAIPRPLFDRLFSLARIADPELELEPMPVEADPDRGVAALGAREDASVRLAKCIYQLRRSRGLHFDDDLFSEPAWDLLLYLYVRTREGRTTCVSGACRGASAPSTTALRWLTRLEEDGMIERELDHKDARRSHVRLSPPAMAAMHKLLGDLRMLIDPALPG